MYKGTGTVFHIQRFSISDGPGIRTVVFLKGCPLDCAWCHNPEAKRQTPELMYKEELCIGCGACADVCALGNHHLSDHHTFVREGCADCMACAQVCPTNALQACGQERTVAWVMEQVLKDKIFYEESGGGVTISGGEPLLQYDFVIEFLRECKKVGLHTAIETCGASTRNLEELNRVTDLWLYDIKLFSAEAHRKYTGVSNEVIFRNLHELNAMGAKLCLRCPIIPDVNFNMAHFDMLGQLAQTCENVQEIHLEPYHPLGVSKAAQLGRMQTYANPAFLDAKELVPYAQMLQSKIDAKVVII